MRKRVTEEEERVVAARKGRREALVDTKTSAGSNDMPKKRSIRCVSAMAAACFFVPVANTFTEKISAYFNESFGELIRANSFAVCVGEGVRLKAEALAAAHAVP